MSENEGTRMGSRYEGIQVGFRSCNVHLPDAAGAAAAAAVVADVEAEAAPADAAAAPAHAVARTAAAALAEFSDAFCRRLLRCLISYFNLLILKISGL